MNASKTVVVAIRSFPLACAKMNAKSLETSMRCISGWIGAIELVPGLGVNDLYGMKSKLYIIQLKTEAWGLINHYILYLIVNSSSLDLNPCRSNPCQNGAHCRNNNTNYHCDCLPGYKGLHCEHGEFSVRWFTPTATTLKTFSVFLEIDLCFPNPCYNNVSCVNFRTDFQCHCPPGFKGRICDQSE